MSRTMKLSTGLLFVLSVLIATWGTGTPHTARAAVTVTVNSTLDTADFDPTTLPCETAAGNGVCTLRAAIQTVNNDATGGTINFSVSPSVFAPGTSYDAITRPVTINGLSQSGSSCGAPLIELNGGGIVPQAFLVTNTPTVGTLTLSGVVIRNFNGNGVILRSPNNTITCSFIGTTVTGNAAAANAANGVLIDGTAPFTGSGNTIGASNLISGNLAAGVRIQGAGATANVVKGNNIGMNLAATAPLPNAVTGVVVDVAATGNTIGGGAGAGNFISGNGSNGISLAGNTNTVNGNVIGLNIATSAAIPNATDAVWVTGTGNIVSTNTISGNGGAGVRVDGGSNSVTANTIGTNPAGTSAIPNLRGVHLIGASNTVSGNLISGNTQDGVLIATATAISNTVKNNKIGTNTLGSAPLPNVGNGVAITGTASSNIIGGPAVADRNLISGNLGGGVLIAGPSNTINGNFIGTDVAGTGAVGNTGWGINISAVSSNQILNNTISGNVGRGILGNNADSTTITGNFIGTTASGSSAIPNSGASGYGIQLIAASDNNIIGGSAALRNVISGNTMDGLQLDGDNNNVQGNYIGTNALGTGQIANSQRGIALGVGTAAANNLIGGAAAGQANRIAFNGSSGIIVTAGSNGNQFRQNEIYGNSSLVRAIDLLGAANNSIPNPDMVSALAGSSSTVSLQLTGFVPFTTYTIEYFQSDTCLNTNPWPTGHGEGKRFLGSAQHGTDGTGAASFFDVVLGTTNGDWVTATATDPVGNTSEFSDCIQASGGSGISTPTVTSVNPANGVAGNQVHVLGTGFVNGATVTFAGVPATVVTFVNSGDILVTVPAGSGTVSVTVTNPDTGAGTCVSCFTYLAGSSSPTCTSLSVTTANIGSSVTLTGSNFIGGQTTVTVGSTPALTTVQTANSLIFTVPSIATGTYNVFVTNSGNPTPGNCGQTLTVGFSGTAPFCSALSPTGANVGQQVYITGGNFQPSTGVTINGVPALSVFVTGTTQIQFTVPSVANGTYSVVIQNQSPFESTTCTQLLTVGGGGGGAGRTFSTLSSGLVAQLWDGATISGGIFTGSQLMTYLNNTVQVPFGVQSIFWWNEGIQNWDYAFRTSGTWTGNLQSLTFGEIYFWNANQFSTVTIPNNSTPPPTSFTTVNGITSQVWLGNSYQSSSFTTKFPGVTAIFEWDPNTQSWFYWFAALPTQGTETNIQYGDLLFFQSSGSAFVSVP